ncbi:hypothetical protein [Halorussus marinus]|uniref:hypothetical protein n=1 Tax=Halorussus marinus TaxID=2505976 RepID=UPI00106E3075|nr:hypothetical protein [Halorussus marinus]
MSAPARRATAFSATVAVLVAALAGLGVGAAAGARWATVASLLGAGIAALGVRASQARSNDRRAAGSAGIVAGALVVAGVAAVGESAVALLAGLAVGAAAVNATVSLDADVARPVGRTVARSASVLVAGSMLAAGLSTGAFGAFGRILAGHVWALTTAHDLARLLAFQVELLVGLGLLHWAVPVLDDWLPDRREHRAATLGRLEYRIADLPRGYWLFLGLQFALALTAWGPRWFDRFLESLSTLGAGVRLVLRSGVLHGAAGVLVALSAAVLVGRGLQRLFVAWAGRDPPRALSHAAGGVGALVGAAIVGASPLADVVAAAAGPAWSEPIAAVGVTPILTGGVAVTLFAVAVGQAVIGRLVRPWIESDAAAGFAAAAAALVVAALLAAHGGASALAVFTAVAGALAVLDVGSNAVALGTQIGPVAETRAGEATHAVGSLLVGAAGVAVATLTGFVMGSVSISVPAWRARLAVALLLVSVLCFAIRLGRE